MSALVLHVRLHDGRYHGEGDWPPSPARLFQALVAGGGLAGPLGNGEREALRWLEKQGAPIIAAPRPWQPRRGVLFYMPNNDSDRIEGDPLRMAKIRTATKVFRPYFFDAEVPFVYAWPLAAAASDEDHATAVCSLAERLYQLGRGLDMAWGWGEVIDDHRLDELLTSHPGRVFRPSAGKSATMLPAPCSGSLESIEKRFRAYGERFRYVKEGRAVKVVFRKPPRPHFKNAAYDSPPARALYELRQVGRDAAFAPWPLTRVSGLVVRLRDGAVDRLKRALHQRTAEIERVLVGRKPDGTNNGPPEDRVRIIPLPSIGHFHADREIRRVLVEVPATCPLRADDVCWAFSGLDVVDEETGEVLAVLTRSDDNEFLRHYGIENETRCHLWRTVTPAALPEGARRRRIDPAHKRAEAKRGVERAREQAGAAAAVCQALRHAGVDAVIKTIRLQREPFEGNGCRVEPFADGTRFQKERLWHIEIALGVPVEGPLILGDGRFLGLGLMAPARDVVPGTHAFEITAGLVGQPEPVDVARALRRAVMARVQATIGADKPLAPFFSGHAEDGAPIRGSEASHLSFAFEPESRRLLILAPHVVERRAATSQELGHLRILDAALEGFCELRAGHAGIFSLSPADIGEREDSLLGRSRKWKTVTPYVVTRHAKCGTAAQAVEVDVRAECRRLGLPPPEVESSNVHGVPEVGLTATVTLRFNRHVEGPLLLGRTRYLGGGLFAPVFDPPAAVAATARME